MKSRRWLKQENMMSGRLQNAKNILPGSISLCMIVKNEEAVLADCLDSAQNYVDQIVIVDTGSKDKTLSIAKRYTEEIYQYTWNNDFASARNESIKYATSEWILVLDADHQLIVEDYTNIPQNSDCLGWMISEVSGLLIGSTQHLDRLLLFKNTPSLYYLGKIHEDPLQSIKAYAHKKKISDPIQALQGVSVIHSGYDESKIKLTRNLNILDSILEKEPSNPHYVYKHLLTLRGLGKQRDYLNAIENLVHDSSWDNDPPTLSIIGILGLMGEAVVAGDVSAVVLAYFQMRAAAIGKNNAWFDTRICVPYAKLMIKNSNPMEAIKILESCIRQGVAPREIAVSRKELIAPFQLLFSLYSSQGRNNDIIHIMGQMPNLLSSIYIRTSEIFESISKSDPVLSNYIYTQMEGRYQTI